MFNIFAYIGQHYILILGEKRISYNETILSDTFNLGGKSLSFLI